MGRAYSLLLVNDTSTPQGRWMAREGGADSYSINVDFSGGEEKGSYYPGVAYLAGQMSSLVKQGVTFQECVFTTHGSAGTIKFGTDELTSFGWYSQFYNRGFHKLFPTANAVVYFAGCQVAVGASGWKFLEAAARTLLQGAGGTAIGWTSNGYKFPFINKPIHFSGHIWQVSISAGGDYLRFSEGGELVTDEKGFPARPY